MAAFQSCAVDGGSDVTDDDVTDDVIARQQLVPDASRSSDNSDSWPSWSRGRRGSRDKPAAADALAGKRAGLEGR